MSSLEQVLEAIRQAALHPQEWESVQKQTERYLGAIASQLASVDHIRGNRFQSQTTKFPELDAHLIQVAPVSEPVRFAAEHPNWRLFSDYDYITEEEIRRSAFYNEDRKFGIGYRIALRLVDTPGISRAIVWFWRPEDGHPQKATFEKLTEIAETLRLAAHVGYGIGSSFEVECSIVDALDGAGASAFLIEGDGRLVHANDGAAAILNAADGLHLSHGILSIQGKSAKDLFERRCAEALAESPAAIGERGGTISIPRPSGLPPYFLALLPITPKQHFVGVTSSLILILVDDPASQPRPATSILADGFGLTAAEACVAAELVAGASPSEIADIRGVSKETVREQLKAGMSKVGVRRQIDLVRLVASIRSVA